MDSTVYEQLLNAHKILAQSVPSPQDLQSATEFCENFKRRPDSLQYAHHIFTSSNHQNSRLKFFCLQIYEHHVCHGDENTKELLKRQLPELVLHLPKNVFEIEQYIVEKLSAVIAELAKREWPQRWAPLFSDYILPSTEGENQMQVLCLILEILSEESSNSDFNSSLPVQRRDDILKGLHALVSIVAPPICQRLEYHFFQLSNASTTEQERNRHVIMCCTLLRVFSSIGDWLQTDYIRAIGLIGMLGQVALYPNIQMRENAADALLVLAHRSYENKDITLVKQLGFQVMRATNQALEESIQPNPNQGFTKSLRRLCAACVQFSISNAENIIQWESLQNCVDHSNQLYSSMLQNIEQMISHPSPYIGAMALTAFDSLLSYQKPSAPGNSTFLTHLERFILSTVHIMTKDAFMMVNFSEYDGRTVIQTIQDDTWKNTLSNVYLRAEFESIDEYLTFHTSNRSKAGNIAKTLARTFPELIASAIDHLCTTIGSKYSFYVESTTLADAHSTCIGHYIDGSCSPVSSAVLEWKGFVFALSHLVQGLTLSAENSLQEKVSVSPQLFINIANKLYEACENLLKIITNINTNVSSDGTTKNRDPLLIATWCQAISAFGGWFALCQKPIAEKMAPQIIQPVKTQAGRLIEALFQIVESVYSPQKTNMTSTMVSIRVANELQRQRRAALALVHFARFIPGILSPVLPTLTEKVGQIVSQGDHILPQPEHAMLYEILVLASNAAPSDQQKRLLADIVAGPLTMWCSDELFSATANVNAFLQSMGFTGLFPATLLCPDNSPNWEQIDEISKEQLETFPPFPPTVGRDRLLHTLGALWSVRRRAVSQESSIQNPPSPFAEYWPRVLPCLYRLFRCLIGIWGTSTSVGQVDLSSRNAVLTSAWGIWMFAPSREEMRSLGQSVINLEPDAGSNAQDQMSTDATFSSIWSISSPIPIQNTIQFHYAANNVAIWYLRMLWHCTALIAAAAQDGEYGLFAKGNLDQMTNQSPDEIYAIHFISVLQNSTFLSDVTKKESDRQSFLPARIQCQLLRQFIIPLLKYTPFHMRESIFKQLGSFLYAGLNTSLRLFQQSSTAIRGIQLREDIGCMIPALPEEREAAEALRTASSFDLTKSLAEIALLEAPNTISPQQSVDMQIVTSTAILRTLLVLELSETAEPLLMLSLHAYSAFSQNHDTTTSSITLMDSGTSYNEQTRRRVNHFWVQILALLGDLAAIYYESKRIGQSQDNIGRALQRGVDVVATKLFPILVEALIRGDKWALSMEQDLIPIVCDVYCFCVLRMLPPPQERVKSRNSRRSTTDTTTAIMQRTDFPNMIQYRLNKTPEGLSLAPREFLLSISRSLGTPTSLEHLEQVLLSTGPQSEKPTMIGATGQAGGLDLGALRKRRRTFRDYLQNLLSVSQEKKGSFTVDSSITEHPRTRIADIAESLIVTNPTRISQPAHIQEAEEHTALYGASQLFEDVD